MHTPGPWKVTRRVPGLGWAVVDDIPERDFPIVITMPAPSFALGACGALVAFENAEANAALLAAAPALLEAAQAARWYIETVVNNGTSMASRELAKDDLARLRAAIAQATPKGQ